MMELYRYAFGLLVALSSFVTTGFAQEEASASPSYYTVIGTFAIQSNAQRFVRHIAKQQIKSDIFFDAANQHYYVFTNHYQEWRVADSVVRVLRCDTAFYDAWVRRVPFGNDSRLSDSSSTHEPVSTVDQGYTDELRKKVFLSVFDGTDERLLDGKVKIIDINNANLTREVDANQYVALPKPSRSSSRVLLICDIFGYRRSQHEVNLWNPLHDSAAHVELVDTTLFLHFNMIRHRRGDIMPLYNVYFYNDAAIMMSQSQFQLEELASMLLLNPTVKVLLHGHANGNYFGKMIVPTSHTNFFSVSSDAREIHGSAKLLSQRRAEIVRDYLIFKGVDPERIHVRAWGGKRPTFDRNHVNAGKNLRVEVEIVEDESGVTDYVTTSGKL
jgi:outer membrane protein OmpA-like peptidoglycan-associated protein